MLRAIAGFGAGPEALLLALGLAELQLAPFLGSYLLTEVHLVSDAVGLVTHLCTFASLDLLTDFTSCRLMDPELLLLLDLLANFTGCRHMDPKLLLLLDLITVSGDSGGIRPVLVPVTHLVTVRVPVQAVASAGVPGASNPLAASAITAGITSSSDSARINSVLRLMSEPPFFTPP